MFSRACAISSDSSPEFANSSSLDESESSSSTTVLPPPSSVVVGVRRNRGGRPSMLGSADDIRRRGLLRGVEEQVSAAPATLEGPDALSSIVRPLGCHSACLVGRVVFRYEERCEDPMLDKMVGALQGAEGVDLSNPRPL